MSRVTADLVAHAAVSFDALQSVGDTVYWIEGRPEGDVLVRWSPRAGRRDVLPKGWHAASYVHEYGGGAYVADWGGMWFCNAADQRIYHCQEGRTPLPVTPVPETPHALRYADLRLIRKVGRLVCVRERHEPDAVHNELISLPIDGSAEPRVIASGRDFYMSPTPSPDGLLLAWVSWDIPLMPWDGSWLWLAEMKPDGTLVNRQLIAGGENESVCQPQWGPDGVLYFVSDRSGWWNLYAWRDDECVPVVSGEFELAAAPWEFGYRTYAVQENGIIAIVQQGPEHYLATWSRSGVMNRVAMPYTSMKPYMGVTGKDVILIASSPNRLPEISRVSAEETSISTLASAGWSEGRRSFSQPQRFTFPTRDGAVAHGLYHPPATATNQRSPLLVRAHPGPTSNWPLRLDLHAQYFTSHGFAVADIDYRGSTGYGRAYRLQLRHRWGRIDATDCADAGLHLAAAGLADRDRIAIWGASAGGFTVLSALSSTEVFQAGIARSAIIDPNAWGQGAPKFQAHHAALLAGHLDDFVSTRPLLLIHGDADPVTPLNQVRALSDRNPDITRLMVIPGAGHSFRRARDIARILAAELDSLFPLL
ncbi:prolyl oligopeptidase family serine peptidase [Nonomuraea sp. NEAU-A123]|uniref:S9 family peptidase n=1 Tax=Nonomuraea sp. NEAU-A123 TaxID=2839649 RepID=UPI001BE41F8C|nr:prolyl oligopeptidase family serine peptidase [Nonomuraea sp. NEAU-A123]MBT2229849.1 prolyl oligopeptidase family serine peptidase [Nonomuraea sp. NEAU-A123]